MKRLRVGITIGDINGIGPEVIIKALSNDLIANSCTPIIYGSSKVLAYHKNIVNNAKFSFVTANDPESSSPNRINVINSWPDNVQINLGETTKEGGQCAYAALDKAVQDLSEGKIDVLVTAPINKHAMKLADFPYPGHTEYIAEKTGETNDEVMFMVSDDIKVGLVTGHVPISQVAELISVDKVVSRLQHLNTSLKEDFGIEKPTIAVLGLNPHAGDTSTIGNEDEDSIVPAIAKCKELGLLVSGPYAADAFFAGSGHRKFDGILAMYHDQGLIPFKYIANSKGVNFTAGLRVVRTSPFHGTAFDIAGKNAADPTSMREAIFCAMDIYRNRMLYQEEKASSVKQQEPLETIEE